MEVERERIIMESKKWNIIYPAYLNSKYTIEQGILKWTIKNKKFYK